MTNDNPLNQRALNLAEALVGALSKQRQALAVSDWTALSEAVPQLQEAVYSISGFPGGIEGLREELSSLSAGERNQLEQWFAAAAVDRKTASELIKINLQRFNALKSFHAVSASDDTYGLDSLAPRPGLKVSTHV